MNRQHFAPNALATPVAILAQTATDMPTRRLGRPPKPLSTYPNRLREARERLGRSTTDVARSYGITTQTLQKYETGDLQLKVKDLEGIARALGIPASQLLNSTDPIHDAQLRALCEVANKLDNAGRRELLRIASALVEAKQSAKEEEESGASVRRPA